MLQKQIAETENPANSDRGIAPLSEGVHGSLQFVTNNTTYTPRETQIRRSRLSHRMLSADRLHHPISRKVQITVWQHLQRTASPHPYPYPSSTPTVIFATPLQTSPRTFPWLMS